MNLLIDFGNSRCKWALSEGGTLQQFNSLDYMGLDNQQRVDQCLKAFKDLDVNEVHAVSVLGEEFTQDFVSELLQARNLPVKFHASQEHKYGLSLNYKHVDSYGDDRYAALVAAHHQLSGNKIVVDCGTANTIDAIDEQGNHQGGLIMPGVHLMLDSLVNKASGIDFDDTSRSVNLLCDNTQDAVYSGCITQMQNGVLGVLKQLIANQQYIIVLTGGESALLDMTNLTNTECIVRPHLVLEGLQIMQS